MFTAFCVKLIPILQTLVKIANNQLFINLETKLLDRLGQSFRVEMPKADSLNGYLNAVLPKVRPWSEDLKEEKFYTSRPWMEIRDDDSFHALVLHFFNAEGEYIKSIDGEGHAGSWRHQNNKLFITLGDDMEIFDLAFLDGEFFILRKSGKGTYFFMMIEGRGRAYKDRWRDAVELLFKKSQSNVSFYILIAIAVVLAVFILLVLR